MQNSLALEPIPFLVLTGFLGAGKTTRLNQWLKKPEWADTLVIINEYGEAGLDHLLIEEATSEVVLLAAGCACCTLRGDLVVMLEDLLRRRDNARMPFFRRVVLETTGLADPLPVYHAILQHPYFAKRFRLDGTITLIDAIHGQTTLETHNEARRQVALADWLMVTKTEAVTEESLFGLNQAVSALNPSAPWLVEEEAPAAFQSGRFDASRFAVDELENWLGQELGQEQGLGQELGQGHGAASHQSGDITTFSFTHDAPISEAALLIFREAMRMLHGPKLLRMKGIIHILETPEQPAVIHAVQSVLSPIMRLAHWPSSRRRTRLVFITEGIMQGEIEKFWLALVQQKQEP